MLSLLSVASTPTADRATGAILGSFVADAAAMPLHWIYNVSRVAELLGPGGDPAFYPTPSCPFYKYPFGQFSPYGQQTFGYLGELASAVGGGRAWPDDMPQQLEEAYYALYRDDASACDAACGAGCTCYLDGSTKGFLNNEKAGKHWPSCGADDDQANAMAHMPAVVARFAGDPKLLDRVAQLIQVTQATSQGVAFGLAAARILEHVRPARARTRNLLIRSPSPGRPGD